MIGAKAINENNIPHGVRVAFGRCSRKVLEGWGFNNEKMGLLQIFKAFFSRKRNTPKKRKNQLTK